MSSLINSDAVDNNPINIAGEEKVMITAQEFAAKCRDKTECYHKVGHEFGCYLPPPDNVTTWHLRDLISNVKKPIKGTDVQHFHVP